jgi:cysteinyl-tRNA synthetase
VLHSREEQRFEHGSSFRLSTLEPFQQPLGQVGLPAEVEMLARSAHSPTPPEVVPSPPREVLHLVQEREAARARRDWAAADALRSKIAALGWQVLDTQDGPHLEWAKIVVK